MTRSALLRGALTGVALLFTIGAANALDLVALSAGNDLVAFSHSDPSQTRVMKITGLSGSIVGGDVRPADGQLYVLTSDGGIYRVALGTAAAASVSKLSVPFDAAGGAVVDFNPVADRMRIIGGGGKVSLRVNVETGQAVVDKPLAYGERDRNAGKAPMVTAGAYINSVAGAKETQLFDVDSSTGNYVIQDPPNDGILTTIGTTGLAGKRIDAIDIFTDASGAYTGFAVADNGLYSLDVAKGTLTLTGPIAGVSGKLVDIAVLPPR